MTGPMLGVALFVGALVYLTGCLLFAMAVVHVSRSLIPDRWVTRAGHLARWDA